jgi:hypothetical protein
MNYVTQKQFDEQRRNLAVMQVRISDLSDQVQSLQEVISGLLMTPAVAGAFPPLVEIEKIQAQVFHTPDLSREKRKGGATEWSLRFEYWHRGRQKEPINVALLPPEMFRNRLAERRAPAQIMEKAELMLAEEKDQSLGGPVRRKLVNGGRAYCADQIALMLGHLKGMEDVWVGLTIGDEAITISGFRPSNGTKLGKSLWFAVWKPAP